MKKGSIWNNGSYSRQALPRPSRFNYSRLYTTPSKKVNEAAVDSSLSSSSIHNVIPPQYVFPSQPQTYSASTVQSFLHRRQPYTLLPTPLPSDQSSPINDFFFTDSPTQDHFAIMDACLHNAHNVPRAQAIFTRLRSKSRNFTSTSSGTGAGVQSLLTTRVYNEFLDIYLGLATAALAEESGSPSSSTHSLPHAHSLDNIIPKLPLNATLKGQWRTSKKWISTAYDLYDIMESESESISPNANTYAIMLLFYLRFNSSATLSQQSFSTPQTEPHTPHTLLPPLVKRETPLHSLLSSPSFTNSTEVHRITHLLSRAAVDLGFRGVVEELGRIRALATIVGVDEDGAREDPLKGVPEVKPVIKMKTRISYDEKSSGTDDTSEQDSISEESESESPFNLSTLRTHLAQASYARLVLPATSDTAHRQKLLEASVYDVALSRLRYSEQKIGEMGLGTGGGAGSRVLKRWMWEWHLNLVKRLEAGIEDIVASERVEGEEEDRKKKKRASTRSKGKSISSNDSRSSVPLSSPTPSTSTQSSKEIKLGPFLSLLTPTKLSLITILEIMRLQGTGGINEGMKTARALLSVGKSVEMEYVAEVLKKRGGINFGIGVGGGNGGGGGPIPLGVARAVGRRRLLSQSGNNVPSTSSSSSESKESGTASESETTFFSPTTYTTLKSWRSAALEYEDTSVDWTSSWTQALRARVGSFLVDSLMDVAVVTRRGVDRKTGEEVEEDQPAFFHSYEYVRGHKLGVIRLNPVVAEELAKDGLGETLHPRHLPMLIPPKPWLSHDNGGYVYSKTSVMRYKDTAEQLTYLRHASELGNVELLFAGLDVLGSTPWKINKPVFDVILTIWNTGEAFLKIPPATYGETEPSRPADLDQNVGERMKWIIRMRSWNTKKSNAYSERCSVNYKIEIARAFIGDTFYLPHNIDFRGRSYPVPPHLSHVGDDLSRGLLTFAEGRELGERGLRWLKIHLANLYGYDKGSFEERINFVEENLDDVFDSAVNPLEGKQWWTNADDPWQCLACCIELRNALTSPDPQKFESCLPVHQDGTCNGLQHYAALGGDDRGAAQVNLSVTDRPSDVYTYVAQMVNEQVEIDAKNGHELAKLLEGKISRKVVKQTVMTTVYGVTFVGARAQIEKQLKDKTDLVADECWQAAAYIAKSTIAAIGDLFQGAKDIQIWLTTCARLIAKGIPESRIRDQLLDPTNSSSLISSHSSRKRGNKEESIDTDRSTDSESAYVQKSKAFMKEQMSTVIWTTPLGLPVVQPYRKIKRKQIMTALQTVYISDPNSVSEVNVSKQASAFPPNFIHSLDATHMMLTALECKVHNLTFASVHDSYWTHAATIDKMSEIIRETFIALHESDILGKLRSEFMERYKDYKIPLVALRSPSLLKRIQIPPAALGLIVETPEQIEELEQLPVEMKADAGMDDVSDEASTNSPTNEADASFQNAITDADLSVDAAEDEPKPTPEKPKKRKPGRPKGSTKNVEMAMLNRFINLTDVLPPLPKKGSFDVKTIKKSQYFFS